MLASSRDPGQRPRSLVSEGPPGCGPATLPRPGHLEGDRHLPPAPFAGGGAYDIRRAPRDRRDPSEVPACASCPTWQITQEHVEPVRRQRHRDVRAAQRFAASCSAAPADRAQPGATTPTRRPRGRSRSRAAGPCGRRVGSGRDRRRALSEGRRARAGPRARRAPRGDPGSRAPRARQRPSSRRGCGSALRSRRAGGGHGCACRRAR